MGICHGGGQTADDKTLQINDDIRLYKKEWDTRITLLMIGTGDSGKSTFFKQMKILHMGGIDFSERSKCAVMIRQNVMNNFMCAVHRAEDLLKKEDLWDLCQKASTKEELDDEYAQIISKCWSNNSFKSFVTDTFAFQSFSSSPLLFEEVLRIASPDFVPDDKYVLHCRTRTTGIQELEFPYLDCVIQLVDVGGQRSERRKWLSLFDCATAIIFLAAMDEYDLPLEEDHSVNRLDESLQLFRTMSGSEFLREKKFVLLLNKQDVFMKKVSTVPLSDHRTGISDKDGRDWKASSAFLQGLYEKAFQQNTDDLTVIQTVATDSDNCRKVFQSIAEYVAKNSMKASGIIV